MKRFTHIKDQMRTRLTFDNKYKQRNQKNHKTGKNKMVTFENLDWQKVNILPMQRIS